MNRAADGRKQRRGKIIDKKKGKEQRQQRILAHHLSVLERSDFEVLKNLASAFVKKERMKNQGGQLK